MTVRAPASPIAAEPLTRLTDLDEYREGLECYRSGAWNEDRWTGFRVRFGVYGLRQPGVHMVRIKIPGGVVPVPWLRAVAQTNRTFAKGDAHLTTRQGFQIYHVPLERTPETLASLYEKGVTTREACGNTIRNVTSCSLAGVCPRERLDAGKAGAQLALSWLRHPLTQNMPRKVKIAVSGCATDCGATMIHDLGLIAVEKNGQPGFRVVGGGGLGSSPRSAIPLADFVTEMEVPAVMEALLRLHQRYSDRHNRNAARIKFVVARFGSERFQELFTEEFARLRPLPQRPWAPLAWRTPSDAPEPLQPYGVMTQHDGRIAIVTAPELGQISSDQLDALADLCDRIGVTEVRLTREQNLALIHIAPEQRQTALYGLKAIGLPVPEGPEAIRDVISCPGTTTCRIGITNSPSFARHVLDESRENQSLRGLSVRISGCHNSCGLHHIGDFGFHGMAKKIAGQSAPHYQIHLGGEGRRLDGIALGGPIIPARLAPDALALLRDGYRNGQQNGESVRAWAERLGKEGILALLQPIIAHATDGETFVDWGEDHTYAGPLKLRGECAAPVTADGPLADLADDALITMDRALLVNQEVLARDAGQTAIQWATRRALSRRGASLPDDTASLETISAQVRAVWSDRPDALAILAQAIAAYDSMPVAVQREQVALWIDTVRALVLAPDPELDTAALEAQMADL